MSGSAIYLDHHATTPVDPRVLDAMLPYFSREYGNAGSVTHEFGLRARRAADSAIAEIAAAIGAEPDEIVITSGATESNNLALRGVAEWRDRRPGHIISTAIEHPSILDPLARLQRVGWTITLLPVASQTTGLGGRVTSEALAAALTDDTVLVSIALANHEVGTIQPLAELVRVCRQRGVLVHTDATQALGQLDVNVDRLDVDLLSFSAHKIYGPKGIGALYVRRRGRRVRLASQIDGGGQQGGLRSGTLDVPGVIGIAKALELCRQSMPDEPVRLAALRNRLAEGLAKFARDFAINGPPLDDPSLRLPQNLNCRLGGVDGPAIMAATPQVAISAGAACSSAQPEPSHVLRALGLDADQIRSSLRFGLGRFNDEAQIDAALAHLAATLERMK